MVLDKVVDLTGGKWVESPYGLTASVEFNGKQFKMLKPGVAINDSGQAVRGFLEINSSNFSKCLIIHDDMDLPSGKVRHKAKGGDGGHRGVRSLIQTLQTNAVHRLKIGVRDPVQEGSTKDLVVSLLASSQLQALSEGVNEASGLVLKFVDEGGEPKHNLRGG